MRMALEAFEEIIHWYALRDRNDVLLNFVDQNPEIKKAMQAITALRQALEQADEPAGFVDSKLNPIKREWVSLTDEDLPALAGDNGKVMELQQVRRFAKVIEAVLRSKNT